MLGRERLGVLFGVGHFVHVFRPWRKLKVTYIMLAFLGAIFSMALFFLGLRAACRKTLRDEFCTRYFPGAVCWKDPLDACMALHISSAHYSETLKA